MGAFKKVLYHGRFILGPEVEELESELAEFMDVPHAIGVSSGTDALLLAFMVLGLGPGDEVLCPTFTFFATAGTIARTGATPVFVDSCPVSFNIDIEDARRKVTDKTKAIVPVHLFGQSADMDGVMTLAREHDLRVVEDAAQAIGATYQGKKCGGIGDFGALSFFPSKNLGGLGDSGLLVTTDDELAEKARIMRVHGGQPRYYHHVLGGNFRIDTLQAALLRVKLRHYRTYTEGRQANAEYYTSKFSQMTGVRSAEWEHRNRADAQQDWLADEGVQLLLPVVCEDNESIWNQYTLRVVGQGKRDSLRSFLAEREIGAEIYYPVTMDQQPCFNDLSDIARQGCEVAHRLAEEVISLPIYPELSVEQKDEVIASVTEFLK